MKQLISKMIALTITILSVAPTIAIAKDFFIGQQPTAMFHTLNKLSTDGTHPTAMTGQQLEAVEGMAHPGSLVQEILASNQTLVNQQLQNVPQVGNLTQEILASAQALVSQQPSQFPVQNVP